jgi:ribosomal-protein-alanine N-acetyltransferase
MPQVFITTPRLKLREWQESDFEPYIEMNKDEEVMEFLMGVRSRETVMGNMQTIQKHFDENGYGLCAVERLDNGEFIGYTGLSKPNFETSFTPCVEIGWRLSKQNWGQGFATEAATACLGYGFEKAGLNEIYSWTSKLNLRSINVMKKTGMHYIYDFEHPLIDKGHWLCAHVLYKIEPQNKN